MEDIIHRAQMGDQIAFRQLIEKFNPVAWRTARVLLPDRTAAEDALQEAWLDVWKGLPHYQIERPFRPWLLKLVANRCLMMARRRVLPTVTLDLAELETTDSNDMLKDLLRQEKAVELQNVLATLPQEQQRVLELRFFAELELTEIALVTHTPLGTVKSRLHRALQSLRIQLYALLSVEQQMEKMI